MAIYFKIGRPCSSDGSQSGGAICVRNVVSFAMFLVGCLSLGVFCELTNEGSLRFLIRTGTCSQLPVEGHERFHFSSKWQDSKLRTDCTKPDFRGALLVLQGGAHHKSNAKLFMEKVIHPILSLPGFQTCANHGKGDDLDHLQRAVSSVGRQISSSESYEC